MTGKEDKKFNYTIPKGKTAPRYNPEDTSRGLKGARKVKVKSMAVYTDGSKGVDEQLGIHLYARTGGHQ
jgi:hypothetical protein